MNVAVKALTFLFVAAILAAGSFMLFAFMIIAMNGFSESDAIWGIYLFVIWAFVGGLISAISSVIAASQLVSKKKMNIFLACMVSAIVFIMLGGIINSIGVVAGIATAEVVRTNF